MFDTPILLLTYNRTSHLSKILSLLKDLKASKVFIASDGPKNDEDLQKVLAVRKQIKQAVTWTQLNTYYCDTNQGCRLGVSKAITWFFKHTTAGIILEDDCLPDPSFFPYVQELLEKYKTDERILSISGDLIAPALLGNDSSYFFSRFAHVWGWATWKRAWDLYHITENDTERILGDAFLKEHLTLAFSQSQVNAMYQTLSGKIDTWDYIWKLAHILNNGLAILPEVNLVSNLGFGKDATHTKLITSLANRPTDTLQFPLRHPSYIMPNIKYDHLYIKKEKKASVLKDIFTGQIKQLFFSSHNNNISTK